MDRNIDGQPDIRILSARERGPAFQIWVDDAWYTKTEGLTAELPDGTRAVYVWTQAGFRFEDELVGKVPSN